MLNWTSSFSIWEKPKLVWLLSHHLRPSWLLHRQISCMMLVISVIIWTILRNWTSRSMGIRGMLGVCLFSQVECYSPILESVVRNYSIDGLPLHMLQVCIISRGSRFEHTQNQHQKPPWPGDVKRLMHFPQTGTKNGLGTIRRNTQMFLQQNNLKIGFYWF